MAQNYPIEIVYNDNIIHQWKDGTCTAYYMDEDGDIQEVQGKNIADAKSKLDKYTKPL
jgi:hypothetical protein